MKKYFLTITFLIAFISFLHAANQRVVIDSVRINSGSLTLDFHVDEIIDEKVAEGLQKGLTSTIEYQVELWEKRGKLINHLVTQQDIRMKVFYDNWEHKYVIMSSEEKRLANSLETVKEKCSQVQNFNIIPTSRSRGKNKYFFNVKVILRPLSIENYQEIKHWLSGKAKNFKLDDLDDTEKQEKKLKGGLFKMFLALTGFGDRVISGKSDDFKIQEGEIVWGK
jgi:hypothetical protein